MCEWVIYTDHLYMYVSFLLSFTVGSLAQNLFNRPLLLHIMSIQPVVYCLLVITLIFICFFIFFYKFLFFKILLCKYLYIWSFNYYLFGIMLKEILADDTTAWLSVNVYDFFMLGFQNLKRMNLYTLFLIVCFLFVYFFFKFRELFTQVFWHFDIFSLCFFFL